LKQFVYKPYAWKKAINSPEHKLQVGSFIFSKKRGSNGSQSMQNYYFAFKVIEINGDLVRLSVIRKLSDKNNLLQGDFSTTKEGYKNLKENIQNLTITGILTKKLYTDWDLAEKPFDPNNTLIKAFNKNKLDSIVENIQPKHQTYKELVKALEIINTYPKEEPTDTIKSVDKITLKDTNNALISIKKKLLFWKDLTGKDSLTNIYDQKTFEAVKRFQERHGLAADGVIGYGTLSALNFSKEKRKQQIIANLERWRWYNNDLSFEDYQRQIDAIREILKGNFKESMKDFKRLMNDYAQNLHFEEAQKIKEKIEILENYQSRSTIVNPKITNVDVFSIVSDESAAYVNFLQISHGSIIRSHTMEIKKKLDETDEELLELAVVEMRERFNLLSKEVIVPFEIDLGEKIKVTIPQLGDKKQILDLSIRNAKFYRIEQLKQLQIVDPDRHVNRIMAQMQKDLRLPAEPRHIECFDNSNIQGTNPVAACVVFKDGKASKKDYRHFNVKTVEGPDDFASMTEIVYRRYKRLLDENEPLPQLIIIDGGKGQLSAALKSIDDLGLRGKIAIIGIAKRLEELFYPGDSIPLYLDKKSETLKVIQQLRNEAHRFGITFHRDKRSKAALNSSVESIPGIGEKTMLTLIQHFKSVKRLKLATEKEISDVVGVSKAKKIVDFYKTN
ncbi:peptidoglycan-binding protein, partial [Flavobacterium sp. LBUM151]